MTKMKSKKMTKSTFAIIIMAIAMVAMLAFGGTYAYFTATATNVASNDLTTGVVCLKATETLGDSVTKATGTVVYGQTVLGTVTMDVTDTTVDSYVFATIDVAITANKDDLKPTIAQLFGDDISTNEEAGWLKLDSASDTDTFVYYKEV